MYLKNSLSMHCKILNNNYSVKMFNLPSWVALYRIFILLDIKLYPFGPNNWNYVFCSCELSNIDFSNRIILFFACFCGTLFEFFLGGKCIECSDYI